MKTCKIEDRVDTYHRIIKHLEQKCFDWACGYANFCVGDAAAEDIKKNLGILYQTAAVPLTELQDGAIRTQTTLPELRVICDNGGTSGAAICNQMIQDSKNRVIAAGGGNCK